MRDLPTLHKVQQNVTPLKNFWKTLTLVFDEASSCERVLRERREAAMMSEVKNVPYVLLETTGTK